MLKSKASTCIYQDFDSNSSLRSLERNMFVPFYWHLSCSPPSPPPSVRCSSLMTSVILLVSSSCISFLISPWISWEKSYSFYESLYFVRQLHCTISFTSTSDSLSTQYVMELSLSETRSDVYIHTALCQTSLLGSAIQYTLRDDSHFISKFF